eukprot:sb/3471196/
MYSSNQLGRNIRSCEGIKQKCQLSPFFVWDLRNMRTPITTIHCDASVNRLAVSENTHHTLAVPFDNRHVRLYDMQDRVQRTERLPAPVGMRSLLEAIPFRRIVAGGDAFPAVSCHLSFIRDPLVRSIGSTSILNQPTSELSPGHALRSHYDAITRWLLTADWKDDTCYDKDAIYEERFVSTEYRLMIL